MERLEFQEVPDGFACFTNSVDYRIRENHRLIHRIDGRDHVTQTLDWFNKFVIGPPMDCPAGSAQEMADKGYVGLYRKVEDWESDFLKLQTNGLMRFEFTNKWHEQNRKR